MDLNEQVGQASPHRLIELLFDGLLGNLDKSRQALTGNDIEALILALGSAKAILQGLNDSLDVAEGGALAANLGALYDYMARRLQDVEMQLSDKPLAELEDLVQTLKEAWQAIEPEHGPDLQLGVGG